MTTPGDPSSTPVLPFAVRWLTGADVPQVREIEREVFPGHYPTTPFDRELHRRTCSYLVACRASSPAPGPPGTPPPGGRAKSGGGPARLAATIRSAAAGLQRASGRTDSHVVGFLGMSHAADEAHVFTIGVRRTYRGRGLGELLLIAAIEEARSRGAATMTLEVRPSNHVARNLYAKYGFDVSGVRKGYYVDNREDALILTAGPIGNASYVDMLGRAKQEHQRRWGRAAMPTASGR